MLTHCSTDICPRMSSNQDMMSNGDEEEFEVLEEYGHGADEGPLIPKGDELSQQQTQYEEKLQICIKATDPTRYFVAPTSGWSLPPPANVARYMDRNGNLVDPPRRIIKNIKPVPETKEFYDSKNSVEKPEDGDSTKPTNAKCLSCIYKGYVCHGSSVEKGKCLSCRGYAVTPGKKRQTRTCHWKVEAQDVFTYREHEQVFGGRKIEQNTAEGKEKRAGTKPYATIFEAPFNTGYGRQFLQWLMAGFGDTGLLNDEDVDDRWEMLAALFHDRHEWASGRRPAKSDVQTHVEDDALLKELCLALRTIHERLLDMRLVGDVVELADILAYLPDGYSEPSDDDGVMMMTRMMVISSSNCRADLEIRDHGWFILLLYIQQKRDMRFG